MHVIEVTVKVFLIADGVFPETALPDAARLLANAGCGAVLFSAAGCEIGASESGFEQAQAQREIGVAARQRHEQMQMIGQQSDGVDVKRMEGLATRDRLTQQATGLVVGE